MRNPFPAAIVTRETAVTTIGDHLLHRLRLTEEAVADVLHSELAERDAQIMAMKARLAALERHATPEAAA